MTDTILLTTRTADAISALISRAVASASADGEELRQIKLWRDTIQGQATLVWLEALSRDLDASVRLLTRRTGDRSNSTLQARAEYRRVQFLRVWLLHDLTPQLGGVDAPMRAQASAWLLAGCSLSRNYPSPHHAVHRGWCRELVAVLRLK